MDDNYANGQPASVDTPAMPGDGQEADTSQGYTIEIAIAADGSIKVSVEPAAEEAGEESGSDASGAGSGGDGAGEDDEAQSVPNIREAIKLVLEIYKNQGEPQDAGADADQISKGYGGA